jgi:3-methyl-2-oxobutanoate hydroxymethyltransferase
MAHVGLTPQSVHGMGGYRIQGRGEEAARKLLDQALNLEKAGAFSIVLEGMPADVGRAITHELQIPTIGIGAGPECDAQVLVINDLLGLNETTPKFATPYVNLREAMTRAVTAFAADVEAGTFPDEEHSYH